ncbi:hypothetical protein PHLH8_24970 [Pseudomonas sp. Pc102]|uniref:hypothetical protein n=1 Tax=Pseudomonas sp. Pc102 TaxID=2678261 RepID=UPI001BCD4499|nr:hypothetical protein [Pseudomonas sp. Pc102]BBP82855.1 hypothetical protein PHLH8_24970 [Pseudomonas sp. Pc102]
MSDEQKVQDDQPKEIDQKELDEAAIKPSGVFEDILKQIAPTVPPIVGNVLGKS